MREEFEANRQYIANQIKKIEQSCEIVPVVEPDTPTELAHAYGCVLHRCSRARPHRTGGLRSPVGGHLLSRDGRCGARDQDYKRMAASGLRSLLRAAAH